MFLFPPPLSNCKMLDWADGHTNVALRHRSDVPCPFQHCGCLQAVVILLSLWNILLPLLPSLRHTTDELLFRAAVYRPDSSLWSHEMTVTYFGLLIPETRVTVAPMPSLSKQPNDANVHIGCKNPMEIHGVGAHTGKKTRPYQSRNQAHDWRDWPRSSDTGLCWDTDLWKAAEDISAALKGDTVASIFIQLNKFGTTRTLAGQTELPGEKGLTTRGHYGWTPEILCGNERTTVTTTIYPKKILNRYSRTAPDLIRCEKWWRLNSPWALCKSESNFGCVWPESAAHSCGHRRLFSGSKFMLTSTAVLICLTNLSRGLCIRVGGCPCVWVSANDIFVACVCWEPRAPRYGSKPSRPSRHRKQPQNRSYQKIAPHNTTEINPVKFGFGFAPTNLIGRFAFVAITVSKWRPKAGNITSPTSIIRVDEQNVDNGIM